MSGRRGEGRGRRNPLMEEQAAIAARPFSDLHEMPESAQEEGQPKDSDTEQAIADEDPSEIPVDEREDPEDEYLDESEKIETPLSRNFMRTEPWIAPSLEIVHLPGNGFNHVIHERKLLCSKKIATSNDNKLEPLRQLIMERILLFERFADFLLIHFNDWLERSEEDDRDLFLPAVSVSEFIREKWEEIRSGQKEVSGVNTFVGNVLGNTWLKLPNREVILCASIFTEDRLPVHRRSVIVAMTKALSAKNGEYTNDKDLLDAIQRIFINKTGKTVDFSLTTFRNIKREFYNGNFGLI